MQAVKPIVLALLTCASSVIAICEQDPAPTPVFVPGKYCCEMASVGNVCVVFKADNSYAATGTLSRKPGASRGTWRCSGANLILTPIEETGSLSGYLSRFRIEEHPQGVLTWLPKTPQNFGLIGGAVVYPQYRKANGSND